MSSKTDNDRESLRKLLPVVEGKVKAVVAAKGHWTGSDLSTRTIQVCNIPKLFQIPARDACILISTDCRMAQLILSQEQTIVPCHMPCMLISLVSL
jgi:hypothetical protein